MGRPSRRAPRAYSSDGAAWPQLPPLTPEPSIDVAAWRAYAHLVRRIAGRLEALGLTQTALAERAGISRQALSTILRGEVWPDTHTLFRICLAAELDHIDLTVEPAAANRETPPEGSATRPRRPAPPYRRRRCRACRRLLDEASSELPHRAPSPAWNGRYIPVDCFDDPAPLIEIAQTTHRDVERVQRGDCLVVDRIFELMGKAALFAERERAATSPTLFD